jgi:hypothetical protein
VRKLMIFVCCVVFVLLTINGSAQQMPSLRVVVFHGEECDSCGSSLEGYLSALRVTYPFLEIETFDVRNSSSRELLDRLEKRFSRKGNELPVAFVEDHVLSGEKEIREELEVLVLEHQIRQGLLQHPLGFPATDKLK